MSLLEKVITFLSRILRKRTPREVFDEKFFGLVREFGLEGRVELRTDMRPPYLSFVLFPVVEDRSESRSFLLPEDFVDRMRLLVRDFHPKTRFFAPHRISFRVGPGQTLEEIQRAQELWAAHCNNFWATYD